MVLFNEGLRIFSEPDWLGDYVVVCPVAFNVAEVRPDRQRIGARHKPGNQKVGCMKQQKIKKQYAANAVKTAPGYPV